MQTALNFIQVPASRSEESFATAVKQGLSSTEKSIPSRFFYDSAGSRLFEQITTLPEYYLTRCETEILERYPGEIVDAAGDDFQIVEFGSGSSEKTRLILRAAVERQPGVEYVPIDISTDFLRVSAEELAADVPGLRVSAVAGDYLDALAALPAHSGSRLYLFLGSTIGNFEPDEAVAFLSRLHGGMRRQDRLLVGVDLKKPASIIEPAYNDAAGVTAAFNKNLLVRINRELCGRIDLGAFEHRAPWIEEESRIEMRLVSTKDQTVTVEGLDLTVGFRKGEFIHTENSHKWSPLEFQAMAARAALSISKTWRDSKGWFALHLMERR